MKYRLLLVSAHEDDSYPIDIDRVSIVVDAFRALRTALREKDQMFRNVYGIRIESKAPKISFNEIYTGQWIGIAEYIDRSRRAFVRIAIGPKYKKFVDIYRETIRFLAENLRPLATIAMDLSYGYPTIEKDFRLAAWIMERYIDSESPFTIRKVFGIRGHVAQLYRDRIVLSRRISEVSTRFYSTIFAAITFLIRSANDVCSRLPPELEGLVRTCIEEQMKVLQTLLHKPVVQDALIHGYLDDIDENLLLQLAGALKPIEVAHVSEGISRAFMVPSTKVYELYVLTKVVEVLGGVQRIHSVYKISTPEGMVFFNRPPKKLSRIVYRIAGTVPHPDIVVVRDDTTIVIDAKYRENVSRLELKEVLRLVAYAVDLARNHRFKVVVACLSRAMDSNLVVAKLNGIEIEIVFVEVSPESSIHELRDVLLD